MRIFPLAIFFGIAALACSSTDAARLVQTAAQSTRVPTVPPMPGVDGRDSSTEKDPFAAVRQAQMARAQTTERQKRIADDTAKLLVLATELKQDVDKANKNELSLDVIRKAEEIERLAHDVKTRMKG